jgi:hypothetical protein
MSIYQWRNDRMLKINCAYSAIVPITSLKPNPKNNNYHSSEQIDRLAKIIKHKGQRSPIVVSSLSGYIVKGHCRLEAMKLLGATEVAIDLQDYQSEQQEYEDMTADNAIALWAELDLSAINSEIEILGIEDTDLLGLKDLTDDLPDDDSPPIGSPEDKPFKVSCPMCKAERRFNDW